MGFPITDREIDRMIRKEALNRPMAIEMVRKGGVPQSEVPAATAQAPRTIIAAYLSPDESPLGRQYRTDLSDVTRVRLASQSNVSVYVLYSESVEGGPLDPGDFLILEDDSANPISASLDNSDPGDDLRWFTLPAEEKVSARLIISTSQTEPELDATSLDGPFAVALQADS